MEVSNETYMQYAIVQPRTASNVIWRKNEKELCYVMHLIVINMYNLRFVSLFEYNDCIFHFVLQQSIHSNKNLYIFSSTILPHLYNVCPFLHISEEAFTEHKGMDTKFKHTVFSLFVLVSGLYF